MHVNKLHQKLLFQTKKTENHTIVFSLDTRFLWLVAISVIPLNPGILARSCQKRLSYYSNLKSTAENCQNVWPLQEFCKYVQAGNPGLPVETTFEMQESF